MKHKLQLSAFNVSAPEQLRIRIVRSPEFSSRSDDRACKDNPVAGWDGPASPLVLTRTFARGVYVEGRLRSTAV
jgi:hypothetical protein